MSSMSRGHSRSAGFSLGEVLVALVVAAMMAAILTRFVAGTRMNAARIGEVLEMTTLSETLLARISSVGQLKRGRTDGRVGFYTWHIEITPVTFVALARRMNEKKRPAPDGDGKDEDKKIFSGFTSMTDEANLKPKSAAAPQINWISYRVAILVEAPSGRRHAADTIKIGPADSDER